MEDSYIGQTGVYCKHCKRIIYPDNTYEAQAFDDGYIYIHDNVPHPDDFNGDNEQ